VRTRQITLLNCLLLTVALVLGGCSAANTQAPEAAGENAAASKDSKPGVLGRMFASTKPVSLPVGTEIHVVLDHAIASNQSKSGDDFEATSASPIQADGKSVVTKGARVRGRVVEARESGRLKGTSLLTLTLVSVEVDGKLYDIETNSVSRSGGGHTKRNTAMIGGGAGAGAVIGAIAGGGKGAAIGAAAGAGAGTAAAAATGKKEITLPAETPLQFKLTQPVTFEVKS
jgi:hypothetical protein